MVTEREVASERSEGAGDRNADAGIYFLNERSSLRTLSAKTDGGGMWIADSLPHTQKGPVDWLEFDRCR